MLDNFGLYEGPDTNITTYTTITEKYIDPIHNKTADEEKFL